MLDALRGPRDPGCLDAAQRLGIYRDAYRARLVEALQDSFSHTARYLGDDGFRELALQYIEVHTPAAASIRWYGDAFPDWLGAAHPQDGDVAELAALDWALRAAFDSADAEPLDAAALSSLSADDWDQAGFVLHPSLRLLEQRWNTVALWQALEREAAPPAARRLPGVVGVAVWRRALQPHYRTLDADEGAALRALQAGERFAAVCDRLAARRAPQAATALAGRWLRRWSEDGLLAGLRRADAGPGVIHAG
ncbi:MAG: hypothetical protein AMJ64_13980 [Betaproteobacteria bacterium SG8_39]|nr:MAG: hypothetical protein AMJ64_13980 [Betaproteobacteria bacterium SG8_39]